MLAGLFAGRCVIVMAVVRRLDDFGETPEAISRGERSSPVVHQRPQGKKYGEDDEGVGRGRYDAAMTHRR